MTTPLHNLLAQVGAMNDLASPFVFTVVDERIVGAWDETHADYAALLAAGDLDEGYRLEVRFDPRDETYGLEERSGVPAPAVEAPAAPVVVEAPAVETAGVAVLTLDGVVTISPWSFDTAGIRDSLVMFLESHGWSRRRSFFARLFG